MTSKRLDDPDLPLDDLMATWPETIPVFMRHQMLCVGCMVNPFHTVMDACAEYGLNIDAFYAELARALKGRALKGRAHKAAPLRSVPSPRTR